MRAVVVEQDGGPEVLRVGATEAPVPGPGDVLVDVAAAGVNFIDVYERTGGYPKELPFVLGSEGAGTVTAVGDGVTDVAVGDRVAWAITGTGYTEQAAVLAERVVRVPEGVDSETAAAVMLQGMTAHYLCESTYPARYWETALVHAAAGGVGLLLTQMLAAKGVRVIATTSTEEKAGLREVRGRTRSSTTPRPTSSERSGASPTAAGWRWCTTAWAGRPSTRASTVCGLAA